MKNVEQMDLVALNAAELQQVHGGIFPLVTLGAVVVLTVAIAIVDTKCTKGKQVKLLDNIRKPR